MPSTKPSKRKHRGHHEKPSTSDCAKAKTKLSSWGADDELSSVVDTNKTMEENLRAFLATLHKKVKRKHHGVRHENQ